MSVVIACDQREAFAQGSEAAKQSILSLRGELDCFAEPVIGRRFAPTRWLAMTGLGLFDNLIRTCAGLASLADQAPKHPAHFGLCFLDPRFQRGKVRCVAGARHDPQQILA